MRTAIITDSNSGIFEEEGRQMGVFVLPMPVILEGVSHYEGVDISHEAFFQHLHEKKRVSTSQPCLADVLELWDTVLNSGYEEAVYIPMSAGLSGSCRTAQSLAQEYDGRIQVVDNHRVSVTQRHAVQDAVFLRAQGCSASKIREILEETASDSIVYVGVTTLDYLKASGRVTPAGAAIGTILNFRPLLVIEGERLDAYAKIRGTNACQKQLIQAIEKKAQELKAGGYPVQIGVAGSFASEAKTEAWKAMVKEAFPDNEVRYDPLTFSVACHVGADAFGMGVSRKITSQSF